MADVKKIVRSGNGAKRKQRFKPEYTSKWPFIVQSTRDEYHAMCTYCKKDFSVSHGGGSDVQQHIATESHKRNSKTVSETKSISAFFASTSESAKKQMNSTVTAECLMTHFIVKHNLPVSVADHLTQLFPVMFPDSKIASDFAWKRTKTTHIIHELADDNVDILRAKLTKTVFSVATDGSSDRGVTEILYPILVRYYDAEVGKIVTSLLSLPACEGNSTGENIFNLLNAEIVAWDLCIGYCSDNASVMTGQNKGVAAFVKREHENIFVSGCTCHLLHLAASHACKELTVKLDELLIDIYYYLDKSAKRKKLLKSMQEMCDTRAHKILKHCATRWLSLETCLKRLQEQYTPLKQFFNEEAVKSLEEVKKKNRRLEKKKVNYCQK